MYSHPSASRGPQPILAAAALALLGACAASPKATTPPAGSVSTGTIADGAVTTPKLADGAVTAAKLAPDAAVTHLDGLTGDVTLAGSGAVSVTPGAGTLTVGLTRPLDADTLGGLAPSAFRRRDPHVLTVSPTPGVGDFTLVSAALASITDNATTPYLVEVGPGTYQDQLVMKQNVTIRGAGEGRTVIVSTGAPILLEGTAMGAPNSALEDLTVESDPGMGTNSVFSANGGPTRLRHVELVVAGGSHSAAGIYAGSSGDAVEARDVTITLPASASIAYGIYAARTARVTCRGCTIRVPRPTSPGQISAALYSDLGGTLQVAESLVDGAAVVNSGTIACVGSFGPTFAALGTTCN